MSSESGTFFVVAVLMVILTCITWTWRTGDLLQWVVAVPILCMTFKTLTLMDRS